MRQRGKVEVAIEKPNSTFETAPCRRKGKGKRKGAAPLFLDRDDPQFGGVCVGNDSENKREDGCYVVRKSNACRTTLKLLIMVRLKRRKKEEGICLH